MSEKQEQPWSKDELVDVAKRQKNIQWLVVAHVVVVAMFISFGTIATGIIGIYFIYKLAAALRSSCAWLYIILAFFPLIGLLALLYINGKATKVLKGHGVRVGVMGATMTDFDKIQ
jgi:hypothetical protein